MSPKLATVIEYKIDEIQSVYRGTIVNMVILDSELHIMYVCVYVCVCVLLCGVTRSLPSFATRYHSGIDQTASQIAEKQQGRTRAKRGSSTASSDSVPPQPTEGAGMHERSHSSTTDYHQQHQQQSRVNFAAISASKRKSSRSMSGGSASLSAITSTEELQDLVRSFKQSSDAFARSFREFRDNTTHAIHMTGHSHIFSFFDGGDVSLGFYTKLSEPQIASFDFSSVNKAMQQIIEELNVLLRNALGPQRPPAPAAAADK